MQARGSTHVEIVVAGAPAGGVAIGHPAAADPDPDGATLAAEDGLVVGDEDDPPDEHAAIAKAHTRSDAKVGL